MTPLHLELDDNSVLAFFITFRTYGTWLHGDRRGSVDRFHNIPGTPYLPPNRSREKYTRSQMKRPPVRLNLRQRLVVEQAIKEACKTRKWIQWATNARSNHVHTVVTADCTSKEARAILKAAATKKMREQRCWHSKRSPWADKGSRRRVRTQKQLMSVIDYVLYEQGI